MSLTSSPLRTARSFPALACAALLAACSRAPDPAPSAPPAAPPSAPPSAPSVARRVVPASATAVDLVAALVDPERVAGFPAQALDYSVLHAPRASFANTPRFEAYLAEPVLALDPDLVVIDPWQAPETTNRLRAVGVRVLALPEIRDWSDARAALELVAREVGAPERGAALIAELDARVAALRERAALGAPWRAVCYSNFGGAGTTAGPNTTLDALMRMAGLDNLVAQPGHAGMSFEGLLTLDPDVIVVSRPLAGAPGPAGDRGGAAERLLYSEAALRGLRAVRERRVVALPAWLFACGSHEIVHGAEVLRDELDALAARLGESQR